MSLPFEEAEYGTWGETLSVSELDAPTHQFVGFEPDPATGWYFMGARVYDPALRRWLSPDPLLLAAPEEDVNHGASLNLYGYADNNPVGLIDPEGTKPFAQTVGGGSCGRQWDCTSESNEWTRQKRFDMQKAIEGGAGFFVNYVVEPSVSAALGGNSANAPDLGASTVASKSLGEEALNYGLMGKGGGIGGKVFGKVGHVAANGGTKSAGKHAAAAAAKQGKNARKLWKIGRYDKAGNHPQLGKVYKDGKELWVDLKGGHGGAEWKVYYRKDGNWSLEGSADKYGTIMRKKHESGKYDVIRDKDISWTKGK